MITVKIAEIEYPIAYTVEAQSEMAEKAGGLDHIKDMIGSDQLSNMTVLLIMMHAGQHRERVLAKMAGTEEAPKEIPTEEELRAIMLMGEWRDAMKAMSEAMTEGNKSEVEIEGETTGKKRRATR